ncbi:ATP-binding protein [Actinomadura kijaniata]|uniref:ATP-binding protein n=1 Tax=Actinomadura kijaniata TaxID=46161 RepID=UPI0008343644|nr:ATP-binding protein [Actinomadura kijaniata]
MTTITTGELRELFLFESLSQGQLDWLAEHGVVQDHPEGAEVCTQGEPAEFFFVLLDGEICLLQAVSGHTLEVTRSDRPGVYGGAVQAYIAELDKYAHTIRAVRPSRLLALPARPFGNAVREWFPMATHLLEGLFVGSTNARRVVDQRERLTALGTITAGLTHELNNPAAAASRAADELGGHLVEARRRLSRLASDGVDCDRLKDLVELQERFVDRARAGGGAERSPLRVSEAEDELGDWLEEHGVEDAWDLAPAMVAAGFGPDDAQAVVDVVGEETAAPAMRWLAEVLEITQLQGEISEATGRITALLDSARQYSQLDRAPHQRADLRRLLDSTLTMLKRKVPEGVRVVTDYDPDLPEVPVYAAELNQVWTNLVVNALEAMGGTGTLTVRAFRDRDQAVVEVADTGPGIPEENLPRIFTPFFTTKPVGQGTGLGLDISWRIVVNRHGGDLSVESRPGDTRFRVALPLTEAPEREG